ncbi:MAG TPA: response regulator transcription factor [Ferruginibacter sp.]|nr:response regulator transcription factor [Niastella sp.]HRB30531.1 response regulator transcription factor [Ferruginibacter sp.]
MKVKTVIYEDNDQLRDSLELLLSDSSGFEVAGTFNNCMNCIKQMDSLLPQLVIMDIDMPGMSGLEGVKQIKTLYPGIRIIVYTVFDDDQRIFDCICNGADGYLLKTISPLKLVESLKEVMDGGTPMSPFVAKKVFQYFRDKTTINADFQLSRREIELLEYLVKGYSYKMIAASCFISLDTVKKHLQNIYRKLHVCCGTEAVAMALKHKIVKLD